jgi:hypothetical protein
LYRILSAIAAPRETQAQRLNRTHMTPIKGCKGTLVAAQRRRNEAAFLKINGIRGRPQSDRRGCHPPVHPTLSFCLHQLGCGTGQKGLPV